MITKCYVIFFDDQKKKMSSHAALHAAHAAIIGPGLFWVGFAPDTIPDAAYTGLLFLGVGMLAYHVYLAMQKLAAERSAWVNWIHIFLVAPLLILVGYLKKDAARRYFEMLMLLGFAATGYHAFYLIRDMMLE